jgi:hypothetical protein
MDSQKNEQLWPDERIAQAFMQIADEDGQITGEEVMFVIKGMRDEMQAKIDDLISELEETIAINFKDKMEDVGKSME